MYIADLHCDTIREIWLSEARGQRKSLRDSSKSGKPMHIDLSKLKKSGYLLQNFALFVDLNMPADMLKGKGIDLQEMMPGKAMSANSGSSTAAAPVDPWFQFAEMVRVFREEMAANEDVIRQVRSWKNIEDNRKAGIISAVLTTEEGGILQGDLSRLDTLYEAGVRMMTITWNYENELGFPNRPPRGFETDFRNFFRFKPEPGRGLTELGKEAVERMEELGILPDVSHLSDEGFYDVAATVKGPFVASHSNARAVCGCSRNLTDDMIRTIAEHGGVIGLNFCPSFLMEADKEELCYSSCEAMANHVKHIMQVGGKEVIALGTDFDGIAPRNLEIRDASEMQKLADHLVRAGLSVDEVEGMFYRNVMRLYKDIFC